MTNGFEYIDASRPEFSETYVDGIVSTHPKKYVARLNGGVEDVYQLMNKPLSKYDSRKYGRKLTGKEVPLQTRRSDGSTLAVKLSRDNPVFKKMEQFWGAQSDSDEE